MSASGRIRIIGGQLRNSRLNVPELPGLRPTPERVRETLFNWLAPVIDGARVLDLCAGTGALGIEALSRGAGATQFVESHALAARALKDNLARLKVSTADVAASPAQVWLGNTGTPFDLVFLDPPFADNLWAGLARTLEQGGWLAPSAWIYVESPRQQPLDLPDNWVIHREGVAGDVQFALYRRTDAKPLAATDPSL